MISKDKVRRRVSDSYAKAVTKSSGCCSGSTKGVAVQWADYDREMLDNIPTDAVENSFGCGNPLAFSGVKEGDTVVDLGSGAGIDLLIAGKIVGESGHVIGVDMTDEMNARANENIQQSGMKNIEVRKGIIEELPVEDNTVDWIISNCVINLSPEKEKVFAEMMRILKPGGQISVSDIVAKDLPEWVLDQPSIYDSCIGGAISEEDYVKRLESAGFKNIKIKDKLVYDDSQLKPLIVSEIQDNAGCGCIDTSNIPVDLLDSISTDLEGKIASIKIYAQKV